FGLVTLRYQSRADSVRWSAGIGGRRWLRARSVAGQEAGAVSVSRSGALGIVFLVVCVVRLNAADPAANQGVAWQPNLKAAHKVAVRDNKPLLLVFGAEWCHFCTKLEQESYRN